ncbi:MAG: YafY family protein [Actinomycetota bacterium]|nr:YafY family protein [Actinomycetota bacterium]
MSRPTARVLQLLEILQNGGTRTAAELATRLGVDERTVRRYVEHLIDLEVPVETVRGRYGGFRLAPGFRMPPLMLTDEEALAVLLGLVNAGARTAEEAGEAGGAANSAVAKVRRVLPKALKARMEALFETAEFATPGPAPVNPEASVLLSLAEAARERRAVVIRYTDRLDRAGERTLCPYGIVAHRGRWYVTGHDGRSGQVRTFRLDRVARVSPAAATFTVPAGFDPAATVLAGLAGTPWRHEVVVRVRCSAQVAQARLPQRLATVEPDPEDGWVVVRFRAERLDWVPGVLGGLGLPFTVREPAELRDLVREWARNFSAEGLALGGQEC